MNITSGVIIGVVVLLVVGAGFGLYYYKKKTLEKFFTQTGEMVKQVPKKKRNSFLLLIFKESLMSSKNKKAKNSLASKLNNPRYVNIQLMQMSKILKDRSKVKNKIVKKALNLFDEYHKWERAKSNEDKEVIQQKAS